jgi:hypothetical protein
MMLPATVYGASGPGHPADGLDADAVEFDGVEELVTFEEVELEDVNAVEALFDEASLVVAPEGLLPQPAMIASHRQVGAGRTA